MRFVEGLRPRAAGGWKDVLGRLRCRGRSEGFVKGILFPGPGNIEVQYNSIGFVKGKGKRKILQSTRALQ